MDFLLTTRLSILLFASFALSALAIALHNEAISLSATTFFTIAVTALFATRPAEVFMLLPFVAMQVSVLLSLNMIEAGGHMIEMGQWGHSSPAAALYAMYSLLFLGSALLIFDALFNRSTSQKPRNEVRTDRQVQPIFHAAFLSICVVSIAWLLLAGLRTGFPLLLHMDRFVFRRYFADFITINILDFRFTPPFAAGVGMVSARSRTLKLTYIGLFTLQMAAMLLYGNKFFIILTSVILFVTPAVVSNPKQTVRMARTFAPFMVLGFIVCSVATYAIYSGFGRLNGAATAQRISDRVSGQGELWFMAADHSPALISFDRGAALENVKSTIAKDPQDYIFTHSLGPFYFVQKYSPPRMYASFIHNGGTVAPMMAYEGYGLAVFGYIGLAFQMVATGFLVACVMAYARWAVRNGNPLYALLPAFITFQVIKLVENGTLFSIISIATFKFYLLFTALIVAVLILDRGAAPTPMRRALIGGLPISRIPPMRPETPK